ncbi:response regulator [Spongiimicrobium salis]|uniref:response regulator n=1 Tax=Spongiimicrobium salis TaxID=1667022 RepID=UPI00374DA6C4
MDTQAIRPKILIVEDEIILAQDIKNRLTDNNYQVVGLVSSMDKALECIEAHPDIDLILIDIVLKGKGDGIALAEQINTKYQIPFIFLTSHSNDAIIERAKKVRPYAYILKPFNDRQVNIAIALALLNFSNNKLQKTIGNQEFKTEKAHVLHIKDSLFLKKNHHFERVPLRQILFLRADSNYCTIHTKLGQFMYSTVLKNIEAQLPMEQFLRTHRSYVVNIQAVNGFEGNMLFIDNEKIPVSKTFKENVFRHFQTI